MWLAQDGNGGVWLCDISPEPFPKPPVLIFCCHAGEIVAISASPITNHIATLGKDGRLHIYDYENHQLILQHQFHAPASDMIWLPIECDSSGSTLVTAFQDGALRIVFLDIVAKSIHLFQAIKAHKGPIKSLILNPLASLLASGSEDQTVFIHCLREEAKLINVQPIGLIRMPSEVVALTWNPRNSNWLLIGCKQGEILHANIPENPEFFTENTFFMRNVEIQEVLCLPMKKEVQRMKRITEVWYKKAIMKEFIPRYAPKITIVNPPSVHDSQEFTASFQREEEEVEISEEDPGEILWMKFTDDETFWVAMSGDECGYLYEYKFNEEFNPVKCITIPEAEDLEIRSYLYRIQEDFRLFNDYWQLGMHDNKKGIIPRLINSRDGKFLFSIGHDGNIFSYRWNCPETSTPTPPDTIPGNSFPTNAPEIPDRDFSSTLSLEEEKQKISDELRKKE
uniref:Uncharacterized protein n=1 Tax=Lutzomyia longipalpis TaxID=7200 RepID=A0A1B0CQZ1_LUTLO